MLLVAVVALNTSLLPHRGGVLALAWILAFTSVELWAAVTLIVEFGEFAAEPELPRVVNFQRDASLGYAGALLIIGVPAGFYFLYLAWAALVG